MSTESPAGVTAEQRAFAQLIVVGASAGGIEALSALVATLPPDLPAPIVVAQHLSPHRLSSLAEILARRGRLPVRTVTTAERLEPGVIYVVPPNRDVTISDHEVRVHEEDGSGPRPSIDLLFRSAADVFGEDLIAVILSGTGSDGALGARAVKEAGGTVIIQNPESAAFPGMPLSLATSIVDIVANPERIGPLLHELLTGAYVVPHPAQDDQLRAFLDQVRDESGIDFTGYKQPTIMRRLQRRLAATGMHTLPDYVRFVRRHPEERQRLISSFLIKVTGFFRDPELFTYLREAVLPELIAEARQRNAELRLWSAGCATGEEAYSLAMLVADLLGDDLGTVRVRIFATDLDVDAVSFARQGVYPARALASVPETMVERFFTLHTGEYEVKKPLRSMLVFGEHDLGQRAPFPRIDLVLCRNVLIYFTPALQRRALQLFAFSLRPNGYLVLGKSEAVTPAAEHFALDQPRLKVFRRAGDQVLIPPNPFKDTLSLPSPARPPAGRWGTGATRVGRLAREAIRPRIGGRADVVLLELPFGVVVVDRSYDIVSINAAARRLFGIHDSAVHRDFVHSLQGFPSTPLRELIDRAFAGAPPAPLVLANEEMPVEAQRALEVTCHAILGLDHGEEGSGLAAIAAIDVTARERMRRALEAAEATARRLAAVNDEVLTANQELTNTMFRLRTENEELLVAAEEVQAATEEVETLNEELQASNEELETLNEELQATIEELNTTNDDLQARTLELQELAVTSEAARVRLEAVLGSIADAVLVVEESGRIVRSNAAFDRLFPVPASPPTLRDEAGRPLPPEATPLQRAARGETFSLSFTIEQPDGSRHWYEANGRRVPAPTGERWGVVTIRDITERSLRHLQEEWLAVASHELRTPLSAVQAALQMAARARPGDDPRREEQRRHYIEVALDQARRVGLLVDQMNDVTRFATGQVVLDPTVGDLREIVDRAVSTARLLAGQQEITVTLPADPVPVRADPLRLEQAVLNLLTNAIAHGGAAGGIEVRVAREDGQATVEVQDQGPGIPPEELATIFERFRRLDPKSGGAAGLGLGLYITRAIVEAHGGTVDARSAPGEGATFSVRLESVDAG